MIIMVEFEIIGDNHLLDEQTLYGMKNSFSLADHLMGDYIIVLTVKSKSKEIINYRFHSNSLWLLQDNMLTINELDISKSNPFVIDLYKFKVTNCKCIAIGD